MGKKKYECNKCGYKWDPKKPDVVPKECPHCKNRKWQLKRTKSGRIIYND